MSDDSETQATAVVTLKVRVPLSQPWSGAETLDQVYRVAARQAVEEIENKIAAVGVTVEVTKIDAVVFGRERR